MNGQKPGHIDTHFFTTFGILFEKSIVFINTIFKGAFVFPLIRQLVKILVPNIFLRDSSIMTCGTVKAFIFGVLYLIKYK